MLNKLSFRLNYSEIEERLDPIFYYKRSTLDLINQTSLPVYKLKDVISMQRGRFGHRPRNDPSLYGGEYPFIQTGDVVRAKFSTEISYSQTLNEKGLKTSRLFSKPVVVLTIAANIGYTAILNYPACFPDSLIGLTSKNDLLELEYINIYISIIRQYIEDLAPQAAQKNINYQQLSSIPIIVPSKNLQYKIIKVWNIAQNLEKIKIKQSKEKIASIDTFLLDQLGILELQSNDRSSTYKNIFIQNSSIMYGRRKDPDYYHKKYNNILDILDNSTFPTISLRDCCIWISSGKTPASKDYSTNNSDYPVIKVGSYSGEYIDFNKQAYASNIQPYKVLKGDIFVLSAAHQAEYVGRHIKYLNETPEKPTSFVGELICIRANEEIIRSELLFRILNLELFKVLINREKRGQTSHIYSQDIKNIRIPVPPQAIQQKIIDYLNSVTDEIESLRLESKMILSIAKQEIEKMILGETA